MSLSHSYSLSPSCFSFPSLSLLLKVGTSNPLLNLLNGAKPIYQLTHFRWIIYPFILTDNATDVTRRTEAPLFLFSRSLSCLLGGGEKAISYFSVFITEGSGTSDQSHNALQSHMSLTQHNPTEILCCCTTCKNTKNPCGGLFCMR